ncbi:hypothetical protein DPQ22_05275 [Candidatus Tokpelaia sp.]|nr:hypothetical protein DPQ22_05275 [Candidatus Tokpelaia sp.]
MQFVKLRLAGFKSFIDPAELVIEAGLTGLVGPDGCGKSSLAEALRRVSVSQASNWLLASVISGAWHTLSSSA